MENHKKLKIEASILNADYLNLGDEIKKAICAGVDFIHLDIMDGNFVPEITFGQSMIKHIKRQSDIPIHAHLMIKNTDEQLQSYIKTGADLIIIHAESCRQIYRCLQLIKNSGIKAGLALNPATPISYIENILDLLDYILIMTVEPGFGGQLFIESMPFKIKNAIDIIKQYSKQTGKIISCDIGVDGGINEQTIKKVVAAGANIIILGTALYNSNEPAKLVSYIRKTAETGLIV